MSYWIWWIIGFVLCGAELLIGAFVMLILGLGAIITGVLIWIFSITSLSAQILIFLIFSAISAIGLYYYYKKSKYLLIGQSQQFLGEIGLITQNYDPENFPNQLGQVRFQKPILGSDVWECRSQLNTKLTNGDRVRLLAFEGKVVLVEAN